MRRHLPNVLIVGAVLWSLAILVAPLAISTTTPMLMWPAALVYEAASLICHQRPERSFHIGGVQRPVCARCSGLYVSAAAAALGAALAGRTRRGVDSRLALLGASLPTALTVGLELVGLAHPSNLTRALSALPLGAAAAWIFVRALLAERLA